MKDKHDDKTQEMLFPVDSNQQIKVILNTVCNRGFVTSEDINSLTEVFPLPDTLSRDIHYLCLHRGVSVDEFNLMLKSGTGISIQELHNKCTEEDK